LAAEKALDSSAEPQNPRVTGIREVIRLLVKAQKAHRLYEGKNAVSERLEADLFERMSRFLAEEGEIPLIVQESRLLSDDEAVYQSSERTNDSLSFLLYRDGIRRLSFAPGLELEELRSFLQCLNRVALFTNDRDDLVTLLWELDLNAIRYFAVEELGSQSSYKHLQDQLGSAESHGGGGESAEAVSLDLEQPVTTVPVEACRLDQCEIEALQRELSGEERAPFRQLVAELALELAIAEDSEEEHEELRLNLVAIADGLVEDGDLAELVGLHEHIDGLATMVLSGEPAVRALSAELTRALSEPARLERILARVESVHAPKPETLTVFLARLGPDAAAAITPWMGRFSSAAYRRAVTSALLFLKDGGLAIFQSSLPLGPAPDEPGEKLRHRQLVREVIHAVTRHPQDEALPLLESLLGSADLETRRESFVAMSRYPDERVTGRALERLCDPDGEVRAAAIDTLVRRGRGDLGPQILEKSLQNGFDHRSLNEKRRLFAALAKLSGEALLDWFRRLLMECEDRWFASQKERQFAEAVAHGIRLVGTARAREVLEECARNGPRFARSACLKELSVRGSR
jgi:hypothetical protein